MPYTWVWIPSAPPPPPAPPSEPPRLDSAPPGRRAKIYRWLDDQSVVHFSDKLESVPERYRSQIKRGG